MRFWSSLLGKKTDFKFSDDPPSAILRDALEEAGRSPLNDLTWRMVLATPKRCWIFDITLFQADAGFTAYERGGRQLARRNASSIVLDVVMGGESSDGNLASALLAFFDTDFTVAANKGKTRETAWNVLALDVQCRDGEFKFTRSAHRLTFPTGRVSLDFMDMFRLLE
ncbi:MAG: hypothetical protein JST24_02250 [Acidobacteria bacterium]|nr:hypothetical protein [Acidobacteriota bacterium]